MTGEKKHCFLSVGFKSYLQSPHEDKGRGGWERSTFPASVKPEQQQ